MKIPSDDILMNGGIVEDFIEHYIRVPGANAAVLSKSADDLNLNC